MKTLNEPRRRMSSLLLGSFLLAIFGGTACSSTSAEEMEYTDIEVRIPTQAEADASAAQAITADNAEAELQKLEDDIVTDKY